jgi:hypothetical protein
LRSAKKKAEEHFCTERAGAPLPATIEDVAIAIQPVSLLVLANLLGIREPRSSSNEDNEEGGEHCAEKKAQEEVSNHHDYLHKS